MIYPFSTYICACMKNIRSDQAPLFSLQKNASLKSPTAIILECCHINDPGVGLFASKEYFFFRGDSGSFMPLFALSHSCLSSILCVCQPSASLIPILCYTTSLSLAFLFVSIPLSL